MLQGFVNQTPPENMKNNYLGYGFSYVFKKSAWQKPRPSRRSNMRRTMASSPAAIAKGCKFDHFADTVRPVPARPAHRQHVQSFPQHLLPDFMLEKLFPADLSAAGRVTSAMPNAISPKPCR